MATKKSSHRVSKHQQRSMANLKAATEALDKLMNNYTRVDNGLPWHSPAILKAVTGSTESFQQTSTSTTSSTVRSFSFSFSCSTSSSDTDPQSVMSTDVIRRSPPPPFTSSINSVTTSNSNSSSLTSLVLASSDSTKSDNGDLQMKLSDEVDSQTSHELLEGEHNEMSMKLLTNMKSKRERRKPRRYR